MSAPCSPCRNCDRLQFWLSIWNWRHSLLVQLWSDVPLKSAPSASQPSTVGVIALSAASFSWSTSMDQSRSVSPFHCEFLAFSYSLTRSEEHTSELQSLMRISYAVFCL